jgi:hydrogenase 3 maturation protease
MMAPHGGTTLAETLTSRLSGKVVVVGVGNPLRGDDAAGCLVAQALDGAPGVTVISAEEVPESYLGPITAARPDVVVLVDAVELDAAPGSAALLEMEELAARGASTHRAPLGLVAEFLRCETGADVFLLAIQPARLGFGDPVSPEVEESAASLALLLRSLVGEALPC